MMLLPWLTWALAQEDTPEPEPEAETAEQEAEAVAEPGYTLLHELEDPNFIHAQLDNGLLVSVLGDAHYPIVSTQIWVKVGAAHEADSEAGFAHLFEHLMFGATTTRDKKSYTLHHISHGGSENAYTSFDETVYISEIPPEGHDYVLEMEADRFQNLILEQENLDNEKKIVSEELRLRGQNNPAARLMAPAFESIFAGHPYDHTAAGTLEDIQGADLELCRKFYHGYYRAPNLHLVVVGPVDPMEMLGQIETLFGPMEGEVREPPVIPALMEHSFPEQVDLREDLPPVRLIAQAYPTPDPSSEDYLPLMLMGRMLSTGQVDHFRVELVENQGAAMEGGTMALDMFKAGGMMAFFSLNGPFKRFKKGFKKIDETMEVLHEEAWLTQDSLDQVRRSLLKEEYRGRYYAATKASSIGSSVLRLGDPIPGVLGQEEALKAITLDQIRSVYERYIRSGDAMKVTIARGKGAE